jgi:hypothetical protein
MLEVPAEVGAPLMVPCDAPNDSPFGSDPDTIDHV